MVKYKVGDKVELNCTEAEFCKNVGYGAQILAENFNAEGVATVSCVFSGSGVRLSEVVKGSGPAIVSDSNIWTIKPLKTSSKKHKENLCKKRGIKIKNQAAEINQLNKKITDLTNKQNSSEWKNGDIADYAGIDVRVDFAGRFNALITAVDGALFKEKCVAIADLSKPETAEQKANREREEKAKELHDLFSDKCNEADKDLANNYEWRAAPSYIVEAFKLMVDAGVTIK